MNTKTLKLSESEAFLKSISIRTIKDVRALDLDLLLVLNNGDRIIITGGAMHALNAPEMALQFADGQLPLARMFEQIERIDVSPEANLTVSSKEITRYNQNNARVRKSKTEEEDGDKPIVLDKGERNPAASSDSNGVGGNSEDFNFAPVRAADHQKQLADAEINSNKESDKNWGVQWPIAAGALALLAAAGGGGGGGGGSNGGNGGNGGSANRSGGGGGAAGAAGSGSVEPPQATLSGAVALGPIRNANITAYDDRGNLLSATTEIVDGRYALTLNRPFYKGIMLLVVRDNTPGAADNYLDEASLRMVDLGSTPLRSLVVANGVAQTVNVTALTELAVIRAGLAQGLTNPAQAPQLSETLVSNANAAVGNLFKVDIIGAQVVTTVTTNARDQAIPNPAYAAAGTEAQNYGAALKAISNMVQIDGRNYPHQAAAIQKLADALQNADASGTILKWATNARGDALPGASRVQAVLFGEPLQDIIDARASSESAIAEAQRKLDQTQQLPNGTTLNDYLTKNHVAIANPHVLIRKARVADPVEWQKAPDLDGGTLILDQGDFLDGSMLIKTPPHATVRFTLIGRDLMGPDIEITLPESRADASGNAIVVADDSSFEALRNSIDPSHSVSARVTVNDGYNSRTNHTLWRDTSDVRVNLSTPPSMTRFRENGAIELVEDTFYANQDNDTNTFPAGNRGDSDGITGKSQIRVTLTQSLRQDERLEFAVANSTDKEGNPVYGAWKQATKLSNAINIAGSKYVSYSAEGVTEANGMNWVKARVVLVGGQYTGGVGNANNSRDVLQFTLDNVPPPPMRLQLSSGKDNGISSSDGITSMRNAELVVAGERRGDADLHIRCKQGTQAGALQVIRADGQSFTLGGDSWHVLKPADRLILAGDTRDGNGKVRLLVRHIDSAGNFTDQTQTFVVDSTGVIEQTVMLAERRIALNDAQKRYAAAKQAFDDDNSASKPQKQPEVQAASTAYETARAADEKAREDALVALRKKEGGVLLDDILSQHLDAAFLPAIINRISRTADVERVNDSTGLAEVVQAAMHAANEALKKAARYGDDPSHPAPTTADFDDMGIRHLSRDTIERDRQLAAINDAIRLLPGAKSNTITAIQTTTDAYLKVLALANGREDTQQIAWPTMEDYAALGITSISTPAAAAILSAVIDGRAVKEVERVEQLLAMAVAAQRIAQHGARRSNAQDPTVDDFKVLGLSGVEPDNLVEILQDIGTPPVNLLESGKVSGTVDTLAEVKAVIANNIGQLQVLINYADGTTPIDPQRPGQQTPMVDNFSRINTGNIDGIVTSNNISAINSALKAVGSKPISSWNGVKKLVDAYNRILSLADGQEGNAPSILPTAADYLAIGVKSLALAGTAADPFKQDHQNNAVRLLNSVLDSPGSTRAQADTVTRLDKLAASVRKLILISSDRTLSLTSDELDELHPTLPGTSAALSEQQLAVLRYGIASAKDDGKSVNSLSKLNVVIKSIFEASARIQDYANDASKASPGANDYGRLGILGLDSELHVEAVNSSLASSKISASTVADPAMLEQIALAYRRILANASDGAAHQAGNAERPSIADYTAIGVNTAPNGANALALLNSALAVHQVKELASVSKLEGLISATHGVLALPKGKVEHITADTDATWLDGFQKDLQTLGVQDLAADTRQAVLAAIKLSPISGDDINSLDKLRKVAKQAMDAQIKIRTYAEDDSQNAPTAADYRAMGVDGVTDTRLQSFNDALASKAIGAAQADSPQGVQSIVDAYTRVLNGADGVARNMDNNAQPTRLDYERIGLDAALIEKLKQNETALTLINNLVDIAAESKVNTIAKLGQLVSAALNIMAQVRAELGDQQCSLTDLQNAGISGVTEATIAAVRSALAYSDDDGRSVTGFSGPASELKLKLQILVTQAVQAQQQICNYARDPATNTAPTLATYRSIGLEPGKHMSTGTSRISNDDAVNAYNSVLQSPRIGADEVNTPTKLVNIATAYGRVLAAADGSTGSTGADEQLSKEAKAITVSDLTTLGLSGIDASTSPDLLNNIRAVFDAMPRARALNVSKLQTTVDVLGKISRLADGTSGNMTAADALAQVSDDLLAAGVDVDDDTLLGNAVVSAIDAVNYSSIATPARLQALVDAYARILAEANEAEPQAGQDYANKDTVPDSTLGSDPAIEDFTAIGASLPGLTAPHGADPISAAHLALLNDALKYKARTQVDSVAEINQLGHAVHRFIETAGQSADKLNAALTPDTRAQWEKSAQILGITGVDIHADEGNLEQILTSLASKRPDEIDGIKKIQGLIDGINAALKVIGDYADQSSNPAPTVEDYTSAGILTPDRQPLVTHDNLAAINAAIDKLTRKDVDTRGKIKTVVTAYRTLLDAADGNMDNDSGQALTAPHYLSIGVPLEQLGIVTLRADRKTIETVNQPPLGLLNSVIGSRNKAAIDTPDKITALARTAADLIRTAREDENDQVDTGSASLSLAALKNLGIELADDSAHTAFLNAVKFKGNLTAADGTPRSDNSIAATHTLDGVSRIDQLVAIAGSYSRVLNCVSTDAPAPTPDDFNTIGILPLHSGNAGAALGLLNSALRAQANTSEVDTIAKLNRLVLIVNQLMDVAAVQPLANVYPPQYPAVSSKLSATDLNRLGLQNMNEESTAALLNRVQTSLDDGSEIASIAALQKMAGDAFAAQCKIATYADRNAGDLPTEADFAAIGLSLPRIDGSSQIYLNAINDALASASIRKDGADTPAKLQGIITAAVRVVDAANGSVGDASPLPDRAEFLALGLDRGKLDQAGTTGMRMLADIIDGTRREDLMKDDQGRPMALPDKLADLLNAIQALMNTVAGRKGNPALSPELLRKLAVNVDGLEKNSEGALKNWPAIHAAIAGSAADGSEVNSLRRLQERVERADAAQTRIRVYAEEQTDLNDATATPTVADYSSIGLVSFPADAKAVRPPLVTAANLEAVNAALRTRNINADRADTPDHVRQVVEAYDAILARANGAEADQGPALGAEQFKAIGLNVKGATTTPASATDAATRSLLDALIGSKLPKDVDTPAEIEALGALVNKVIAQAALSATDGKPDSISAADLQAMGIHAGDGSALSADSNRPALAAALHAIRASADDGSAVDSLVKLQAVVTGAIRAYRKIVDYAERTDSPADFPHDAARPQASDFVAIGLTVTGGVLADDAVSVAASLLTSTINAAEINPPARLQTLLDNWNKVFDLANGHTDQTAPDSASRSAFRELLVALGVNVPATQSNASLDLLTTALDLQTDHQQINSPAKLQQQLTTADHLLKLPGQPKAYGATSLPAHLDAQTLSALGIAPGTSTPGAIAAIVSALSALPADTTIDTVSKLKEIADRALTAHAKLQAYAESNSGTAPVTGDYLDIGLIKSDRAPLVDAGMLAAINSALSTPAITGAQASNPAQIKQMIDAYTRIIDWRDGPAHALAPTLEDYRSIGLTDLTQQSQSLFQSALGQLAPAAVKDAARLQTLASAAQRLTQLADGSGNTDQALLPKADLYTNLGIDMRGAAADKDADGSGALLLGSVIDRKAVSDIDTVAKLQALADLVNKLMDHAAGKNGAAQPDAADLAQLGMDIRQHSAAAQGAILAAIGTSGVDGQGIQSITLLERLAQNAIAALDKISTYAADNSGAAKGIPSVEDYRAMGVAGVTADNLGAINAALASANVAGQEADTQPEVQAIVSTYRKILALADGQRQANDPVDSPSLPSAAELQGIGVDVSAATDPDQIRLLSTALDAVKRDKVDTPSKIDHISASAARVIAAANKGNVAAASVTLDDLNNLGIQGVDADALGAVRELIGSTDVARLNSNTRLQELIYGLLRDIRLIRNYADDTPNTDATMGETGKVLTPTVDNYVKAGTTGVTADNLASINSAVKTLGKGSLVDGRGKLQVIVDAYNHVLQAADGTAGNLATALTRDELLRIGVQPDKLPDPGTLSGHSAALAQATLGVVLTAIDAQPADHGTVRTLPLLNKLIDTATQLVRYAAGDSEVAPTDIDLKLLGVRHILPQLDGSNPSTLMLIQSALKGSRDEQLSTLNLPRLQTIATAAYKLRNLTSTPGITDDRNRPAVDATDADGTPTRGAALTHAELQALRISIEDKPAHLTLLNEVLDNQASFGAVATVERIENMKLADLVTRVMQQADSDLPDGQRITISLAEWNRLGLPNGTVTVESLDAFMAAIKSRLPANVDTIAELRTLAEKANAAQKKIRDYAHNRSDGKVLAADDPAIATQPILQDFLDIGITGLERFDGEVPGRTDQLREGLHAVLASLASASVSGPEAASARAVQNIVDRYNKVLAMADGGISTATDYPTAEDYQRIGSQLARVSAANNPERAHYLSLLNAVIDDQAIDRIDNPAEIDQLASRVARVLDLVGSPAAAPAVLPTLEDLSELGITRLAPADLDAVLARLSSLRAADLPGIATLSGLQALVDKAVAALTKVRQYADSDDVAAAALPSVEDYRNIGVMLSDKEGESELMRAALNSSLASPLIQRGDVSIQRLKGILDTYAGKLLPMADANSNTPDGQLPTGADYTRIGLDVTALGLGQAERLRLFNDLIDLRRQAADVATLPALITLAQRAGRIMALVAQQPGATSADAQALTADDFADFGQPDAFQDGHARAAINFALQSGAPGDFSQVRAIQTLMREAPLAFARIRDYAQNGSPGQPGPDAADFRTLGISGIRPAGHDANLAAIKAVLALPGITQDHIDTPLKLQQIVDSYNRIFALADGKADNAKPDDFASIDDLERIGIATAAIKQLGHVASDNAINLLNTLLDRLSPTDIDTPAKIQQTLDAINKLANTVMGKDAALTVADFTLLKLEGVTDARLPQIRQVLERLNDDGRESDSWNKVNDVLFSIIMAPTIDIVAGDDVINKSEYEAPLTITGTAARDSKVTLRFADGSTAAAIMQPPSTPDSARTDWHYTLTEADKAALLAGKQNANATPALRAEGVHVARNVHFIEVSRDITAIDITPPASPQVKPEQVAIAATATTPALARSGTLLVTDLERPDIQWRYSIDDGAWQSGTADHRIVLTNPADADANGVSRTVRVVQTDQAGNDSAPGTLRFTLDTRAPAAPSLTLDHISVAANGDIPALSNQGGIKVSGLEAGSRWQYKVNGGQWQDGDADARLTVSNAPTDPATGALKTVTVKQIDRAGNESAESTLRFTLDTTRPATPTASLVESRQDAGKLYANRGEVKVEGLEASASWEYRLGTGSWIKGSGTGLTIDGVNAANAANGAGAAGTDGEKSVTVRQTDQAGNTSELSAELRFILDTTPPAALALKLQRDTGALDTDRITSDGGISVSGLEPGATWQYRLPDGQWQAGGADPRITIPPSPTPPLRAQRGWSRRARPIGLATTAASPDWTSRSTARPPMRPCSSCRV